MVIKIKLFSVAKSEAVFATLSTVSVNPSPEHMTSLVALKIGFDRNALLGVRVTLTHPS